MGSGGDLLLQGESPPPLCRPFAAGRGRGQAWQPFATGRSERAAAAAAPGATSAPPEVPSPTAPGPDQPRWGALRPAAHGSAPPVLYARYLQRDPSPEGALRARSAAPPAASPELAGTRIRRDPRGSRFQRLFGPPFLLPQPASLRRSRPPRACECPPPPACCCCRRPGGRARAEPLPPCQAPPPLPLGRPAGGSEGRQSFSSPGGGLGSSTVLLKFPAGRPSLPSL